MRVQTCAGIILFLLRHYYERLIGYKRFHFNSHELKLSGLKVCKVDGEAFYIQSVVRISTDCQVYGPEFRFRFLIRVSSPRL